MTSPHAIGLSGSFGGHRIDQLLFSLALPWQENRLDGSPLSLASGQTAPPKGEPSRGGGFVLTTSKEGSSFIRQTPLPLPLGEVARRSRDGEGSSRNLSCIDRTPCRGRPLPPLREHPASDRRPKIPSQRGGLTPPRNSSPRSLGSPPPAPPSGTLAPPHSGRSSPSGSRRSRPQIPCPP